MPLSEPVVFSSVNADSIMEKLVDSNKRQPGGGFILTDEQLSLLGDIVRGETDLLTDHHMVALERALLWQRSFLLPVLHVFRLAVLNKSISARFFENTNRGYKTIDQLCGSIPPIAPAPYQIGVCRLLANIIAGGESGRHLLTDPNCITEVIPLIFRCLSSRNTSVQESAASALANLTWAYSISTIDVASSKSDAFQLIIDHLKMMPSGIGFESMEQLAILRLLQALETIIWEDSNIIRMATDEKLIEIVDGLDEAASDESANLIATSIKQILEETGEEESSYDLFISYRRETGSDRARLVKKFMEDEGYKVFLDVDDLIELGNFEVSLKSKIESSKVVILVLTKSALDRCSNQCDTLRQEIELAVDIGMNIVPFYDRGFDWSIRNIMPPKIQAALMHNGTEYHHTFAAASFQRLLTMIKTYLTPDDETDDEDGQNNDELDNNGENFPEENDEDIGDNEEQLGANDEDLGDNEDQLEGNEEENV